MNTPIDPTADEPTPLPTPVIKPAETVKPGEDASVDATKDAKADDGQKRGSVFTKGLSVCGNCGTELLGETCYHCGQPTKGLVRQFSSIMGDFLDTVLNIDTRVFRTIGPLIYKPGFLTQEYFSGRRIRYVSPVRLFFFLAVLTFLLAQFSLPETIGSDEGDGVVNVHTSDGDSISKAKTVEDVEKIRKKAIEELNAATKETKGVPMVGMAMDTAKAEVNKKAEKRIAELNAALAPGTRPVAATKPAKHNEDPDIDEEGNISFNGDTWDAEKNPIAVSWAPDVVNKWFNKLAQRAQKNGKRITKEPKVIIEALLSSLPMTLFLMLPVFALLLKVMFIFKRRLYMEHLIVALHSHAFLMLAILLLISFNDAMAWLGNSWMTTPFGILTALLWIWMPIYLFLMQKRVYQQGWILTFIKFTIIGNLHIVLLAIAISFTLIIKMIWL